MKRRLILSSLLILLTFFQSKALIFDSVEPVAFIEQVLQIDVPFDVRCFGEIETRVISKLDFSRCDDPQGFVYVFTLGRYLVSHSHEIPTEYGQKYQTCLVELEKYVNSFLRNERVVDLINQALLFAAERNTSVSIIEEFLRRGANPNCANCINLTPLNLFVGWGNVRCVKLLLERGARTDIVNRAGKSPLDRVISLLNDCEVMTKQFRDELSSETCPAKRDIIFRQFGSLYRKHGSYLLIRSYLDLGVSGPSCIQLENACPVARAAKKRHQEEQDTQEMNLLCHRMQGTTVEGSGDQVARKRFKAKRPGDS